MVGEITLHIRMAEWHTATTTTALQFLPGVVALLCENFIFRHVVFRQSKSLLFLEQSVWYLSAFWVLMFSFLNFRNWVFWLPKAYWSWSLSAHQFLLALDQAPKEFWKYIWCVYRNYNNLFRVQIHGNWWHHREVF